MVKQHACMDQVMSLDRNWSEIVAYRLVIVEDRK